MHESQKIFRVVTPEIPSLPLAREKYLYLRQLDLHERVCILLNRCQKRPLISPDQVEQLLGMPLTMTFPHDYEAVHRALTLGRSVDRASALTKQFPFLSHVMLDARPLSG